jgi:hypothetical protein
MGTRVRVGMKDTPKEAKFRELVRYLLESGVKPTPHKIYEHQGTNKFVNLGGRQSGPSFSGSLSTIRIQEFKRAGWVERGNKWVKP